MRAVTLANDCDKFDASTFNLAAVPWVVFNRSKNTVRSALVKTAFEGVGTNKPRKIAGCDVLAERSRRLFNAVEIVERLERSWREMGARPEKSGKGIVCN
jgi:hypothetical protein